MGKGFPNFVQNTAKNGEITPKMGKQILLLLF
jgi:hypothetical protein